MAAGGNNVKLIIICVSFTKQFVFSQQRKFTFTANEKKKAAEKASKSTGKGKGRGKKSNKATAPKRSAPEEDEEEDDVDDIYGDAQESCRLI